MMLLGCPLTDSLTHSLTHSLTLSSQGNFQVYRSCPKCSKAQSSSRKSQNPIAQKKVDIFGGVCGVLRTWNEFGGTSEESKQRGNCLLSSPFSRRFETSSSRDSLFVFRIYLCSTLFRALYHVVSLSWALIRVPLLSSRFVYGSVKHAA
eukprot:3351909-Amphidinium_carterae.1